MRDFAKVSPMFWTRGSGRGLRGDADAQVLALYLVTCPSASMIGIYYVPLVTIAHETGLGDARVRASLQRVTAAGFAEYDHDQELVWVPNMAAYQIGESVKPQDNKHKGIVTELSRYTAHRFAGLFMARYGSAYNLSHVVSCRPAAKPLASPLEGSEPAWGREREREREENEIGPDGPASVPDGSLDQEEPAQRSLLTTDATPTNTTAPSRQKAGKGAKVTAEEQEVYEHWISCWKRDVKGSRIPNLSPKRLGKIRERLEDGYRVDDLKTAIDGAFASPYHSGIRPDGSEGPRYQDLELICRSAEKTDAFIGYAEKLLPKRRPAAPAAPPKEPSGPSGTPLHQAPVLSLLTRLESYEEDPIGEFRAKYGNLQTEEAS